MISKALGRFLKKTFLESSNISREVGTCGIAMCESHTEKPKSVAVEPAQAAVVEGTGMVESHVDVSPENGARLMFPLGIDEICMGELKQSAEELFEKGIRESIALSALCDDERRQGDLDGRVVDVGEQNEELVKEVTFHQSIAVGAVRKPIDDLWLLGVHKSLLLRFPVHSKFTSQGKASSEMKRSFRCCCISQPGGNAYDRDAAISVLTLEIWWLSIRWFGGFNIEETMTENSEGVRFLSLQR